MNWTAIYIAFLLILLCFLATGLFSEEQTPVQPATSTTFPSVYAKESFF